MKPLRIATRGSKLALWQAEHVAGLLRPLVEPRPVELVVVTTTGDRVQDRSLNVIGGQGAFTKEIQQALLDGRADLAVHSLKDLPTQPVPGLLLAATPPRAAVHDAFVSDKYARFEDLPEGAALGTGSVRRRAQLLHRRPDLRLFDLRGNVDTRLRKMTEGDLDGIVLAVAGLERLGLTARIAEILPEEWMLPAVGQGALGLECRADDAETRAALERINHAETFQAVTAERAFLRALGGGCLVPIAGLGRIEDGILQLQGMVCSPDGSRRIAAVVSGPVSEAQAVGERLAERLLRLGAGEVLEIAAE
ncbi:MAG: hydroxymethylbilane synthase [Gemmatales bacterium]|nr:hydroxymethylbilane synthase [Gemmatales bacterium]MDW8387543.1 hydroxymethylbilane synthase [Gemmatales bacterium]